MIRRSTIATNYYPSKNSENDFIGGMVGEVIDEGSFELMVTEEDPDNIHKYHMIEIVKIYNAPSMRNPAESYRKRKELIHHLKGKDVVCEVIGCDREGNLIATFHLT